MYKEIASDDLVMNGIAMDTPKSVPVKSSSLSLLRFLIFRNYASILEEEYKSSDDLGTAKQALDYYMQALSMDSSAHSLWYHVGQLSFALDNKRLARLGYENGFYADLAPKHARISLSQSDSQPIDDVQYLVGRIIENDELTPTQWKCLEHLCTVLYEIGDYSLCRVYLSSALKRYPGWPHGLSLERRLQSGEEDVVAMDADELSTDVHETLELKLEGCSWSKLGTLLLEEWKRVTTAIDADSSTTTLFIGKQVRFLVDEPIEPIAMDTVANEDVKADEFQESRQSSQTDVETQHMKDESLNEQTPQMDIEDNTPTIPPQAPDDNSIPIVDAKTTAPSLTDDTQMAIDQRADTPETGEGKRKREDDDDDDEQEEDNEQENEQEEKRATLRASKRKQEKIENDESSRKRMLEEEEEMGEKLKKLFSNIKSLSGFERGSPWFNPVQSSSDSDTMDQFWRFFDTKVSELSGTYCWKFAKQDSRATRSSRPNAAPQRRYAIFDSNTKDNDRDCNELLEKSAVKSIVDQMNAGNSGLVDCLCQFVYALLNMDQMELDTAAIDIFLDIVIALGDNIANRLFYGDSEQVSNAASLKYTLTICEYVMDRLIRTVQIANDSVSSSQPLTSRKRSVAVTAANKRTNADIVEYTTQCQFWISLFERIALSDVIHDGFPAYIQDDCGDNTCLLVRYWFLKGKMAQCDDNAEDAFQWYKQCQQLLMDSSDSAWSMELNCRYDATINLEKINKKIKFLEIGKQTALARDLFAENDYEGVIAQMEGVVAERMDSDALVGSRDLFNTLSMLTKSFIEVNEKQKAWYYYCLMLCRAVTELVAYGSTQNNNQHPPGRNDDADFLDLLGVIQALVEQLTKLCVKNGDQQEEWKPESMSTSLQDALTILLRMTLFYVFRHPDFIPLVNNFTNQDMPPHSPSNITKSSAFNDFIAKVWALESSLIQHMIKDTPNVQNQTLPILGEVLRSLHDELGEREICGADNGSLVKHLLKLLQKVDKTQYRRDIYQCYHCIYGVHIAAESDLIEEHNASHESISHHDSEPLFSMLSEAIVEKLNQNGQLKNDLKDAVDTVLPLFERPPESHAGVSYNHAVIESYLNSDIRFGSLEEMSEAATPSVLQLNPEKTSLSSVYFKIFWIKGKILRMQIKNRAKLNAEKTMDDLEEAIEQFTNHVVLDPNDPSGWYELGVCFMQLAEEELIWSASNIVEHHERISNYQRSAFHCFMRVWAIAKSNDSVKKSEFLRSYFNDFGFLVYGMACPPMQMEGFSSQQSKKAMDKEGSLYDVSPATLAPEKAYKLSLFLFSKALAYTDPDHSEWRCLYMIGKCFARLDRPPKEVLDWYKKSVLRRPARSSGQHETILEPLYELCSSLAKYLYEGKIESQVVSEYLAVEPSLSQRWRSEDDGRVTEQSLVQPDALRLDHQLGSETNADVEENRPLDPSHLSSNQAEAFNAIYDKLSAIRKIDKRKWHHRPIYRQAWMQYHVYRNVNKAMEEMLSLFTLRSGTKSHINIWKPGFERPGKHFVYVHEYTMFLIDLAKDLKDTETLKLLLRKLKKAQAVLLHEKEAFMAALQAYTEAVRSQLGTELEAYRELLGASVDKSKFEAACTELTKSESETNSKLLSLLQDLLEMKRLNSQQATVQDTLDELVHAVFVAHLGNATDLTELKNQTEGNADQDEPLEITGDVLLTQARTLAHALANAKPT